MMTEVCPRCHGSDLHSARMSGRGPVAYCRICDFYWDYRDLVQWDVAVIVPNLEEPVRPKAVSEAARTIFGTVGGQ